MLSYAQRQTEDKQTQMHSPRYPRECICEVKKCNKNKIIRIMKVIVTDPGADGWKLASGIFSPFVDLLMHGGRQTAKDGHGQGGDLRWPVASDTQHLPISLQGSLVDGARIVGIRLHRVEETRPERKRFQ